MAQPCFDAKGRELKLGDRRWMIAKKQLYELLFVDANDDMIRLLALPLEGLEGCGFEGLVGLEVELLPNPPTGAGHDSATLRGKQCG